MLRRKHVPGRQELGAANVRARDKKIEKCFREFGKQLGALVSIGHNQQGPFRSLPDQDQVERLRGRRDPESVKAPDSRRTSLASTS